MDADISVIDEVPPLDQHPLGKIKVQERIQTLTREVFAEIEKNLDSNIKRKADWKSLEGPFLKVKARASTKQIIYELLEDGDAYEARQLTSLMMGSLTKVGRPLVSITRQKKVKVSHIELENNTVRIYVEGITNER